MVSEEENKKKTSKIQKKKKRLFLHVLKIGLIFGLTIILLMTVLVITLPRIISSNWANSIILKQVQSVSFHDFYFERLTWSWFDGIEITHIQLPDDAKFSNKNLFKLNTLKINYNFNDIFQGIFRFEILLDGLGLNYVKNQSGEDNVNALLAKLQKKDKLPSPKTADKKPQPKSPAVTPKEIQLPIPVDLSGRIRITNTALSAVDHVMDKTIELTDLNFQLLLPSLFNAPILIKNRVNISIDENRFPLSTINLSVHNLLTPEKQIDLDALYVNFQAEFPGILAKLTAGLKKGMDVDVGVDIPQLLDLARPFLPAPLDKTQASGRLELSCLALGDLKTKIDFDVLLKGLDLQIAKGPLGEKKLGSININFFNKGFYNGAEGRIAIVNGGLDLLDKTTLKYNLLLNDIHTDTLGMDFELGPVYVQYPEILKVIKDFIPSTVIFQENDHKNKGYIRLDRLTVDGLLAEGSLKAGFDNLQMNIPSFEFKQEKNHIRAQAFLLQIRKFSTVLLENFPTMMDMDLNCALADLNVGGDTEISIKNLNVPELKVSVKDFTQNEEALFKVQSDISLKNRLTIAYLRVADLLEIKDVKNEIRFKGDLKHTDQAQLNLDQLELAIAQVKVAHKDLGIVQFPVNLNSQLPQIFINSLDPLLVNLTDGQFHLTFGQMAELLLLANIKDTGQKKLQVTGKFNSQLPILYRDIISHMPLASVKQIKKIMGDVSLDVAFNGRLPQTQEIKTLQAGNPANIFDGLGFIDTCNIALGLNKFGIIGEVVPEKYINIEKLTADPPLVLKFNGKDKSGDVSGKFVIKGLKSVPGKVFNPPYDLELSVHGHHDKFKSIRYQQTLDISHLNIREKLEVKLDNLESWFKYDPNLSLSQLKDRVGADVLLQVNLLPDANFSQIVSGLNLDGQAQISFLFKLKPGQHVFLNSLVNIPKMSAQLDDVFSIQNLGMNLDLAKTYRFQKEGALASNGFSDNQRNDTQLSKQVVAIDTLNALDRTFQEDTIKKGLSLVQHKFNKSPSISYQKLDLKNLPIELGINHTNFQISLKDGLPQLQYFEINILGGTILGNLDLLKKHNNFSVKTLIEFSGINAKYMFPGASKNLKDEEVELSGHLGCYLPLKTELDQLLEEIVMDVYLSHIGKRFLDQLLYALDPHENNEAIVSQRALLKNGSPSWLKLNIQNGQLSLKGEIVAKGVPIAIPPVERISISNLPGLDQYGSQLNALTPVLEILSTISAKNIKFDDQNSPYFE